MVLTDVGSVKQAAIDCIRPCLNEFVHFIPGHPIAGTENSGLGAGFAELFQDRWCILTPLEQAEPAYSDAVKNLEDFWRGLGARVTTMSAGHHDRVLAMTSHLPHLICLFDGR